MQLLLRMNKKLDVGWKMTNSNCQKCNGVTMADPNKITQYYCPKCDKTFEFQAQQNQQAHQKEYLEQYSQKNEEDYLNQIIAESGLFSKPQTNNSQNNNLTLNQINYKEIQKKTNNVSKKLGQKLIQGWAMLQQSCLDCNVPLMKSKKGQKICFGCQKDYAKIQAQEKIQAQNKKAQKTKPKQIIAQKPKPLTNTIKRQQKIQSKPTQSIILQSNNKIQMIQRIQLKALTFLQKRLDQLIDQNDLIGVSKILEIIKKVKND